MERRFRDIALTAIVITPVLEIEDHEIATPMISLSKTLTRNILVVSHTFQEEHLSIVYGIILSITTRKKIGN